MSEKRDKFEKLDKSAKSPKVERRHSMDAEELFEQAHSGGPSKSAPPREEPKKKPPEK